MFHDFVFLRTWFPGWTALVAILILVLPSAGLYGVDRPATATGHADLFFDSGDCVGELFWLSL